MLKLTILISDISEGKNNAFCATIKELNNSKIMADSLEEIFELIPSAITVSQENQIGVFNPSLSQPTPK